MISRQRLQQAAEQGLIPEHAIDPLYRFLQQPETLPDGKACSTEPEPQGEEPLRFIRSFGDVFITVGIVLLNLGIGMMNLKGTEHLIAAGGFLLMAEWLVRVRRLALPGIALLLSILALIAQSFEAFDLTHAEQAGLIAAASALFYARYRMPFSLLPLAASLLTAGFLLADIPWLELPRWFGLAGLMVFAVALWLDSRDPQRCSYLSDSAFWLHLLAAPLMVHGAMIHLLLNSDAEWVQAIGREPLMILFFTLFFLLALLLDRRAMLISTELYVIYAITRLIDGQWNAPQNLVMYIMLALGLFVIFFGAYWYGARRLAWGWLEGTALARYLPPFERQNGATGQPR